LSAKKPSTPAAKRFAFGSRDELLAGARRARDQRRVVAHAFEQHVPIAPHVACEDRLPDLRTQADRGLRSADDAVEDAVEGGAELEEEGEDARQSLLVGSR